MNRMAPTFGVARRWLLTAMVAGWTPAGASADEAPAANPSTPSDAVTFEPLPPLGDGWKPLDVNPKGFGVWIEPAKKQVAVDGQVCLTKGFLEMFACLENTKEHEAVVSLKAKAYAIHAALLAVGAKSGAPAVWQPTYRAAHGTTIAVWVEWMEKGKPTRVRAQHWIRDLKTKKEMAHDWVFGGSGFWKDPETGKQYYRAESGDLICVSNFPTAMLDLPIKSSQANDELAFEAFSDHIPRRHTPVRVLLIPQLPRAVEAPTGTPESDLKKAAEQAN